MHDWHCGGWINFTLVSMVTSSWFEPASMMHPHLPGAVELYAKTGVVLVAGIAKRLIGG